MKNKHNFRNDIENVVCYYGDGYTFSGVVEEWSEAGDGLTMAKGKGMSTDIDPLHEKKYYVSVSLPDYCQDEADKSLTISFSIGGNTINYLVR